MTDGTLNDIEKLEADLWEAADELRANSKLTSTEYCMPVLGVIFLSPCHQPLQGCTAADRGRHRRRPDTQT
jgi:type I restriction enzyme M protein